MDTKILMPDSNDPASFALAASLLQSGQLVAFPTETVYGLGANALDGSAVKKIYRAKGRPSDNPLIVHVADMDMALDLTENVPALFFTLAEIFWPGPLTFILPKAAKVPPETTGGLETVALRMPANDIALALIRSARLPIAAPSSNLSGKPSPTTARHVYEDLRGRIPLILDGGLVSIGLESTVLDISGPVPAILRPGKITAEDLKPYIPGIIAPPKTKPLGAGEQPKAPGMKYTHYAPDGKLFMISPAAFADFPSVFRTGEGKRAVLFSSEGWAQVQDWIKPDLLILLGSRGDLETVSLHLFSALRECDRQKMDTIYIEAFPKEGIGAALMNRIEKASYK